jgi:LmbE family N-acetylglucosaminyl deacetylase/O-antigen/teichoic acid export membrane protein
LNKITRRPPLTPLGSGSVETALTAAAQPGPSWLGQAPVVATSPPAEPAPEEAGAAGRFRRDSLLLVASTVTVGIGNYGYSLALIWILPARQFAVVAAISTLVVVASTAATAAIPWVFAREVAQSTRGSRRRREAAGFTLATALAAGVVAAVLVVAVSSTYATRADEVGAVVWVIAVFIVQVGSGFLQGTSRFAISAKISVTEVAVKLALGLSLAAVGWGAGGALLGAALATLGWAVTGLLFVGFDVARPTRAIGRLLLRSAVRIGGIQVGVILLASLDVVVGSIRFRSSGGMAGYQAMLVFARVPLFISGAVSSVTFRRIVAAGGDERRAVSDTIAFFLTVVAVVVAAVIALPVQFLDLVLPRSYEQFHVLLLPLGIAGMAAGQINVITTFFQAADRIKPAIYVLWPGIGVTAAVMATAGVSVHGLAWIAAASLAATAVIFTAMGARRYRSAAIGRRSLLTWVSLAVTVICLRAVSSDPGLWLVGVAMICGLAFLTLRRSHTGASTLTTSARPVRSPRMRRRLLSWTTRFMSAVRPLTPPSALGLIITARSLLGSGPVVSFPATRRALVLAPHPDDETIGCGGTVALLAGHGAAVTVAVATSGEMSVAVDGSSAEVAERRRQEATAACRLLGTSEPIFLGLPDGGLMANRAVLASRIRQLLVESRPGVVFAPWPLDAHPDHMALAVALADALDGRGCEVWAYEVWGALTPNRIVDVTSAWPTKEAALRCHAGSDAFDLDSHLALGRWRSIFGLSGKGYAEAFLALEGADFAELVRTVSKEG